MIFRLLVLYVLILTGCTKTQNYAPVRLHKHDLVEEKKHYLVQRGDTLYSIGFRSGHGYQRLARWNRIFPPYILKIGQKLKLYKDRQKNSTITQQKITKISSSGKKNVEQKKPTITKRNKKILKLTWQWPIKGRILKYFSKTSNKGIDIVGIVGRRVRSAASGKVVYSGSGLKGYGNLMIIKHNYLYLSAYANNSRLLVKEGQFVIKGQDIAEVGQVEGKPASLHFEIRKNGNPVNPLNYLPKN